MGCVVNLSTYFTTDHRTDGTAFVRLTDDAPEWLTDAVRDAHDGESPDDWRYETLAAIAARIDEYEQYGSDSMGSLDVAAFDIADGLTDVYTHNLLLWVAGNLNRTFYVDELLEAESNAQSLCMLLMAAQCECIRQMVEVLITAVREVSDADQSGGDA